MNRLHPIYIFYDAQKWIPFLLIPVLRALFAPRDAFYILLASLRDVGLAVLLLIYSILKWRQARYSLHNGLTLEQGLINRRRLRLMADDAASVEVERTPLMWICGARRVRINTAGLRHRSDATIYMSVTNAGRLLRAGARRWTGVYAARLWPVTVMAASSSNAALGFLTLAPIVRQLGRLVGEQLSDQVYNVVGRVLYLGLPPLLESVANLFVLGWAFSFVRTLLRYAGFYARQEGDQLHLVSGLVTRRDVLIDAGKITTLELRQTLFMKLFRLRTATITAAGYGREKGARPVIVPGARVKELCAALDTLLPDYPICSSCLRPTRRSLPVYILPPFLTIAAAALPLALGGLWNMAALLWGLFGLWWFAVRLIGYLRAGFGVSRDAVTIRYSRGLAFYEVHVPLEVADCAILTRSPWQIRSGTCTVELRCFGEKRRRHRVRALPYDQALALVGRLANRPAF